MSARGWIEKKLRKGHAPSDHYAVGHALTFKGYKMSGQSIGITPGANFVPPVMHLDAVGTPIPSKNKKAKCDLPPLGWYCNLDEGHGGPCPTYPEPLTMASNIEFPHCDSQILHTPGVCEYCDMHPDWQALRIAQGVAFSDTEWDEVQAKNLTPCPSTFHRSAQVRDLWNGNLPK